VSTADSNVGVDDATLSPGRDPSTGATPPPGSRPTAGALAAAPVRRWTAVLAVVVAVLAAYTAVMLIGVREDAREERILGSLTPIFVWLRDTGANTHNWLQSHRQTAGIADTVMLLLVAAGAVIGARRRAAPVVLLVGVFLLAIWAQVALQSDSTTLGAVLYLAAVAGAVGLGIWRPLRSLPTFRPFPPAPSTGVAASSDNRTASTAFPVSTYRAPISFGWECVLVLVLTLIALISRTWALTELYDQIAESVIEFVDTIAERATTLGGLALGFVQNNGGAVQLLPTQLIFRLFGTSIFTLRMAAVLWSVAAVPLMYTLGRRLGGVGAGVLCSFFLITAPEQLFWARNENLHFAPMAVCALVTAHLALWLVERLSLAAVLVNALWMPWCRWFYSACMVAFLIPIATGVHALVFGRGFWRKAWYVIPGLAIGLTFWIFSLSVLRASMHEWQWQFVDPSAVYGASAWRKHGEFRDASMPDLIRLQAVSMSKNFSEVVRNMSYQTENFSHWCQRSQPAEHRTIMNVGLALLVFVGLGYLLGQPYDRRAFVLLAWWGIAVLPAILSQEPADRRMAMVFPASHAIAGTTLAAFFHLIWSRGGRLADVFATFAGAVGLAAIGLTNLSSHLLLPINPVLFSDYPRFTKPLLEETDAVFTNLPGPFRTVSVFGNIDHFLAAPTCLQYVEPQNWLATALDPQCAFDDPIYRLTIGDEAAERLHQAYNPQRVGYLLTEEPTSAPQIALLRCAAPARDAGAPSIAACGRTLVAMTVDVGDINKLHSPVVAGDVPAQPILAGVRSNAGAPPLRSRPTALVVSGGIRVDADGWYPGASIPLPGRRAEPRRSARLRHGSAADARRRASVHAAAGEGARLRAAIAHRHGRRRAHRLEALSPQHFVSPRVASLPKCARRSTPMPGTTSRNG
jgi:4-amino-4-deoxy-L-arabinose transferase-like glycosyltransferase